MSSNTSSTDDKPKPPQQNTMTTKFCKDCLHFIARGCLQPHCAAAPKTVDLVTGEKSTMFCVIARMDVGPCGHQGNLWEPRQPETTGTWPPGVTQTKP